MLNREVKHLKTGVTASGFICCLRLGMYSFLKINSVVWIFLVACTVVELSAQHSTTWRVGENKCQEEQEACTDAYDGDDKNGKKLQAYHDCVDEVVCQKHERGYNERLQLLFKIDDMQESLKANQRNWWDNKASCLEQSVIAKLICLVVALKIFFANV